jgi:hypothetical protein
MAHPGVEGDEAVLHWLNVDKAQFSAKSKQSQLAPRKALGPSMKIKDGTQHTLRFRVWFLAVAGSREVDMWPVEGAIAMSS